MSAPAPAAWFCPACQAHHAPHVETCPRAAFGIPAWPYIGPQPVVAPVPTWLRSSAALGVGIAATGSIWNGECWHQ